MRFRLYQYLLCKPKHALILRGLFAHFGCFVQILDKYRFYVKPASLPTAQKQHAGWIHTYTHRHTPQAPSPHSTPPIPHLIHPHPTPHPHPHHVFSKPLHKLMLNYCPLDCAIPRKKKRLLAKVEQHADMFVYEMRWKFLLYNTYHCFRPQCAASHYLRRCVDSV